MAAPVSSHHPTAVISPQAELDSDVFVGPHCVIAARVRIGSGTRLESQVVVDGPTSIGPGNRFFPFCSIGSQPQDLKFEGEESFLEIGAHNVFREYVNVNRGTRGGGGTTRIGDHGYFMVNVHIAHDCILGNHVLMANAATLSGHVTIDDHATIGAFSAVHQFCRVGAYGWVGGFTVVTKDVLPYSKTVAPRETRAYGANSLGLERKGFTPSQIVKVEKAFRLLLRSRLNTTQAVAAIREQLDGPEIETIIDFIEASGRGVHK
jgi:UDP-N-acetylglucosamine acyltransferase